MATRGRQIGHGYVEGFGPVIVFQDLDSTTHLFVQHKNKDESRYVGRGKVAFRRSPYARAEDK